MNKLRGLRTYLIGNIDSCPNLGQSWRMEFSEWLTERGILVFNPCDKPLEDANEMENRELRENLLETGQYDELSKLMRRISNVDLRFTDLSDFLVVFLDRDIYPCGSIWEITLANMQKKPILLVMKQGIKAIPYWLWGRLDYNEFFNSFDELKDYLDKVDAGIVEPSKRWLFFEKDFLCPAAAT